MTELDIAEKNFAEALAHMKALLAKHRAEREGVSRPSDPGALHVYPTVSALPWRPIADAPRGVYVLLRGPSGYSSTPHRYIMAKYDLNYRPRQPWVDIYGDSVLDGGEMPTEFAFLEH